MSSWNSIVRQALPAALVTLSPPAWADVSPYFKPESGEIVVSDLAEEKRDRVLSSGDKVRLSVKGQASALSMPVKLQEEKAALVVKPRFSLRPDTTYVLELDGEQFEIELQAATASNPKLESFAPSQAVIPANTLRLYLSFSEPMARGQLRNMVKLVRADGTHIESPFLNLETELWDRDQRRATILFDPGRIKQGVGPNASHGVPLRAGESYQLIVSSLMKSAKGIALGTSTKASFRVGPAERRAIDPSDWQVLAPRLGTYSPFSVAFDRIMDSGAVLRLLTLKAPDGSTVEGEIMTDGGGWSITPRKPWMADRYYLTVHPQLEDVSGNAPSVPFDASAGTIGTEQPPIILTFNTRR